MPKAMLDSSACGAATLSSTGPAGGPSLVTCVVWSFAIMVSWVVRLLFGLGPWFVCVGEGG